MPDGCEMDCFARDDGEVVDHLMTTPQFNGKTAGNPHFQRLFASLPALYFRTRSGFTAPLLVSPLIP